MKNINPLYLYGGIALLLSITGLVIFFSLRSDFKGLFGDSEKEDKKRKGKINRIKVDYNSMTFFASSGKNRMAAKVLANKLESAMEGVSDYKNYAIVIEIFNRIKNSADMKAVYKAFGIRDSEDLYEWVNGEKMTDKQIAAINSKLSMTPRVK